MNRSLDSVLDSVLASINLDNSSSSDEVLVTPVNTRGILFADQVELSHRPLLSAEVTISLVNLITNLAITEI